MSAWQIFKIGLVPYGRLFSYLKPYKGRFILGILFGALYGMTNAALIFAAKYVTAVVFPEDGATAISFGFLGKIQLAPHGEVGLKEVLLAASTVPIIMLFRGVTGYINAYCMLWTSQRVLNDIRQQVFGHILDHSLSFFHKAKGGELMQVVFNQTRMAQNALTTIASDIIKQPIGILSALVALFAIDWKFTLGALALFPICIIPVMIVGKKVRKTGAREEQEAGQLMVVMQEAFAGVRVVKSYAREGYEKKRFAHANEQMLRMLMRWQKAMELIGPLVEFIASFGIALALVYCWWLGQTSSSFLALQGGLILLYPPFKTLSRLHILMQKCLAATTKIFEMIDTPSDVADAPHAETLPKGPGRIHFENIRFAYNTSDNTKPAIRKFDLVVEPGKTYALVGPSGAGKTTLFSLLLRFYDTDEGRILIDGKDIREITQQSLRESIGVVTQDTFLFHDTIRANILYGKLKASEEEMIHAAKLASAHDFIMEKPDGYDSVIGDKGSLLSGGQQQRLAIARALLKNAPILLLDEATSALDSQSERAVQDALEKLSQGRTVMVIAHRLSTILKADQIVVMRNGKIKDVGTHADLYESSQIYKKLCDLQFQGGNTTALIDLPDELLDAVLEPEPAPAQQP